MSTWNPLQMPTTGPPAPANSTDRPHDRREAGDGSGPQVVAVGEPTGTTTASTPPRLVSPCHRISAWPPSASMASTTSCSQFVPGKSTTPTRALTKPAPRPRSPRRWRPRSPGWPGSAAAQLFDPAARLTLVGGVHAQADAPCPPAPRGYRRSRAPAAPARSSLPAGRRCPGRSCTSTRTSNPWAHSAMSSGTPRPPRCQPRASRQGRARQPLVGLHVALPRGRTTSAGSGGRRRRLVPAGRLEPVPQRLLVERRRRRRPAATGRPARTGTSPA